MKIHLYNRAMTARGHHRCVLIRLTPLQRMKSYEGNAALCVIATGLGKTRIFAESSAVMYWKMTTTY